MDCGVVVVVVVSDIFCGCIVVCVSTSFRISNRSNEIFYISSN